MEASVVILKDGIRFKATVQIRECHWPKGFISVSLGRYVAIDDDKRLFPTAEMWPDTITHPPPNTVTLSTHKSANRQDARTSLDLDPAVQLPETES